MTELKIDRINKNDIHIITEKQIEKINEIIYLFKNVDDKDSVIKSFNLFLLELSEKQKANQELRPSYLQESVQ